MNLWNKKLPKIAAVHALCVLIVCLVTSPVSAVQFCTDFLEEGNKGGISGSKTFDREWIMGAGDTVEVDVWVCGMTEPLLTSGFRAVYDSSVLEVKHVAAFDDMDLPGPWDYLMTRKAPDHTGPGYRFACGNLSGTSPDGCDDVLIARLTFSCVSPGETILFFSTIPNFDSIVGYSGTLYDDMLTLPFHTFFSLSPLNMMPRYELRKSQPSGSLSFPACTITLE